MRQLEKGKGGKRKRGETAGQEGGKRKRPTWDSSKREKGEGKRKQRETGGQRGARESDCPETAGEGDRKPAKARGDREAADGPENSA